MTIHKIQVYIILLINPIINISPKGWRIAYSHFKFLRFILLGKDT